MIDVVCVCISDGCSSDLAFCLHFVQKTIYESGGYGSSEYHDRKFAFHCKLTGLGLDQDEDEVWYDKTDQYSDISLEVFLISIRPNYTALYCTHDITCLS